MTMISSLVSIMNEAFGVRPLCRRLGTGGKAKKLAITTCMREPLVVLNAMLRDGTPWQTSAISLIAQAVADPESP